MSTKPVRLELNNSGAWKVIGRFDAGDTEQADLVMDAAEQLIKALNGAAPVKRCSSLRISTDDGLGQVLMHWTAERGMWVESLTGEPA